MTESVLFVNRFMKYFWKIFDKKTFFYYVIVGFTSTAVYFGLFTLLWKIIGINYQIAVSISYFLSTATHFSMNRRYTFRSHGKNLHKHLIKYLVIVFVNYSITMMIVRFVVEYLQLSPYLGMICSIGSSISIGYISIRNWAFK